MGANYLSVNNGIMFHLYGTSASAPVFAGMVALVNAARLAAGKGGLGWINPALYANAAKFVLNDITSGNNKCQETICCRQGFTATEGWDPVTGLGSVTFLLSFLD